MELFRVLLAGSIVLTFIVVYLSNLRVVTSLTNLVSSVLNKLPGITDTGIQFFLRRKYRMKHVEHHLDLPSADYRFPNGQGDEAKFLQGRENSVAWERQYGPIYRIWAGSAPEIVLTRPEHVHEVFKDSNRHIKAHNNNSGYYLGELLGKCVGLVSQSEWTKLRGVTEQAFVRSKSVTYVGLVRARTRRHFDELSRLGDSRLSASIIDPAADLKLLPFWVVAEVIYCDLDPAMERELRELAALREKIWQAAMAGGLTRFSWSRCLFFTRENRDLDAFKSRWRRFNRAAASRNPTLSTPLRAMYDAVENGIVSEEAILQTLDETLYANLDVTLGGIAWNLVFLAAYPDVQQRLREEVSAARHAAGSPENEEAFFDREYILNSSTLLAACISESSRLRPLAAFSVPQAAPTPRVVGGYLFPAGTNFIVDAYALNQRNRQYWGTDGEKYRPDRFLAGDALKKAEKRAEGSVRGAKTSGALLKERYNFWRFGFGPRQCMGKYVADTILRVLLVHLMENYTLGFIDQGGAEESSKWARDPETWINHPLMQLKCEARM